MITDPKKWLNTLPSKKFETSEDINKKISENFINTLPKKTSEDINKKISENFINTLPKNKSNNGAKIYTIVTFLFVLGLISVSLIKNKTRSLQKEINNLQTKIGLLKHELHQSELDYQFLSSPKNISNLAKKYLDYDLINYKKSQISKLDDETKYYAKLKTKKINSNQKTKKISKKIKENISKKIEVKKTQLKKLEELYSKPEELPEKMKSEVQRKIIKTKEEINNLYSNPGSIIHSTKTQKWVGIQIVKAFLGLPIIPGK